MVRSVVGRGLRQWHHIECQLHPFGVFVPAQQAGHHRCVVVVELCCGRKRGKEGKEEWKCVAAEERGGRRRKRQRAGDGGRTSSRTTGLSHCGLSGGLTFSQPAQNTTRIAE